MRGFITILGIITVVCILGVVYGFVSRRDVTETITLPACGIGLVTGLLYLLLASGQSRRDKAAQEDARARKLAEEIVRQRDRQ